MTQYDIVLFDIAKRVETDTIECHATKDKAVKAVKRYRKKGLSAFYKIRES